ncbi:MAG TPA: 30S ribosomal protein S8 [Myxococcota bacterium]|jgi:small subunit ribosomal protein S8|nr:30S ribosomal protein S8 [Myxococcota bacterium]
MAMTDPVADMLTRIRNAGLVGHETVAMPRSGLKVQILRILEQEGFIGGVQDDGRTLRVQLRFDQGRRAVIQGLKRVSTPGRRTYVGKDEIPYVRDGLGVAILTTPRGVLTDRAARQAGVGGEVLCYVW